MNINYLNFNNTTTFHDGRVPYITFKNFEKLDYVRHGFSTRLGGVSRGIYESMNLSFTRGDEDGLVSRNFELIGETLNMKPEDMVYASQTHTANVMEVTAAHRGMGVVRARDFDQVDGLVTNVPGVALVTSYADCVPLFIADPVNRAIGLSHSGWRGTVNNIAAVTLETMNSLYGTRPEDVIVFVGPSICRSCYEIGEDVACEFIKAYGPQVFTDILYPKDNGKYQLDLHRAVYYNFINAKVLESNIQITDLCTCCNPNILYSHRASHGERGGLCGFLEIK